MITILYFETPKFKFLINFLLILVLMNLIIIVEIIFASFYPKFHDFSIINRDKITSS
jgi:hypothetical protein